MNNNSTNSISKIDNFKERQEQANLYFDEHLEKQHTWYNQNALRYKNKYIASSVIVIASGALITFLQIFSEAPSSIEITTALLGAIIILVESISKLMKFGENWINYRKANETMKHEYRLFINGVKPYLKNMDSEEAYHLFIERIENIIGEEQKLYWSGRKI